MKFTVSSTLLQKHLSAIQGVVSNNPVVPILENFLFELQASKLIISASDLQTSMITYVDVNSSDEGRIAIPAKILLDTLKSLADQPISFLIDENTFSVEIVSDNGHYKLAGENALDFPKIPNPKGGLSVEIPCDILLKAITNTIFAASSDELRPAMTGVFLDINETSATFVATDAHRLIRYRRVDVASKNKVAVIIPRKALTLLKNALPSDSIEAKIEFSSSNAFFHFGHIQMICRLIDERFPDYENVIPINHPNTLNIGRLELLNTLKRIAIYANKTTNQVRFKIADNEVVVSAEDLDFSNEASEKLTCDYKGDEVEIGFNAKFMIEMLNNLDSKTIKLELSSANHAGLIIPAEKEDNEDMLMLLMPVMLNNYA